MSKKDKKNDKKPKSASKTPVSMDDATLWEKAISDVKPLKNKQKIEKIIQPVRPAPRLKTRTVPENPKIPSKPAVREAEIPPGVGLDARTDERLRRGQIPIEGRLDLHGLNQGQARTALRDFLIGRQQRGSRCVLVITGKGSMKGGVLKEKVPGWLWEPPLRDIVLRHYPAKPQHGGDGALYILLKRNRD